jgi:hypothetical protein
MQWTTPRLHDLSDLRRSVAQGDTCTAGGIFQSVCVTGGVADPTCNDGLTVGGGSAACDAGSAVD